MTNRDSEELAEPEVTWKSFVPDEEVHVLLTNGAWYRGRVSRKLMEGHGVYFWEDGSLFKVKKKCNFPRPDERNRLIDVLLGRIHWW